jgi:hypothetical protein
MRIIQKGTIPSREKETKCGHCNTKFAYLPEDIKSDQREGSWVVCPLCKKPIVLPYGNFNSAFDR